jgi:hypothetical protein
MRRKQHSKFDELEGFIELGMLEDAMALARKILETDTLSAGDFNRVSKILALSRIPLAQWMSSVEIAYSRLSSALKKRVRRVMFFLNVQMGNHEKGEQFLSTRPSTSFEMWYAMNAHLKAGRLARATSLARRCENKLLKGWDDNSIHKALADYYARIRHRAKALEHLSAIKT